MLNSFFSFFVLVFSTLAFAGGREKNWEPSVGEYQNDAGETYYIGYSENVGEDGAFAFVSAGNPTYKKAEAKAAAKQQSNQMNEGAGTTVEHAISDAKRKDKSGKFVLFGKNKGNKTRDEVIASQEHDCAQFPMTPGCKQPMDGKQLPGSTKGYKAN